jgi:glycosyltransferase involved in cell wall biosynthesis
VPVTVLAVCPSFPSPGRASDGQSVYLHEVGRALYEATGARVHVAAMRLGAEPAVEEGEWFRVERAAPTAPCGSLGELYARGRFPRSMRPLGPHAQAMAARLPGAVAWCHGYETGPMARALRRAGVPVVAVSHFSVAQESEQFLQMATDVERMRAAGLPGWLGRAIPASLRRPFVRAATGASGLHPFVPEPSLRLQLARLAMERALVDHAQRIVAVGRAYAATLASLHPGARARIVWAQAGAPPGSARVARRGEGRVRLLLVGRPCPQKGWEYAAEALHALEQQHPDDAARLSLTTVGGPAADEPSPSPFAEHVLRRLDALQLVEVRHAGSLGRDALFARYDASDVLLHPSVYEPFGLVLLEAMSRGCAVLATDADGPRDIVGAPLVAFRDPARRVDALAAALRGVARAPRAELARRGLECQRAAAAFDWRRCADVHLRALEDAARG